jgi:glycosyltransferase involved in cell wall biosynthesis
MSRILGDLVAGEQLLFRLTLVLASIHLLRLVWLARRPAGDAPAPPPLPTPLPRVTVQLPLYNERHVAETVVRAAAALDWPADRLDIQVLDDSDDDTAAIIDRVAASCRRPAGPVIEVVRRGGRAGFKAGALAHGLRRARGELVAVFDADCVPAPDFLRRTVPHLLADEQIGMVQGRWTFANRDVSWLTRLQALLLQGLMLVEQVVRSRQRGPFQFNGSAGIWRRRCIDDAGGWSDASIAEDAELSFRALLAGWRFVQLPEVEVPTELPESLAAYRSQQRRWVRGHGEVLRRLGGRIARGARPWSYRASMLMHLGRRLLAPMLALQAILVPLMAFGVVRQSMPFGAGSTIALAALWVGSLAAFLAQGEVAAGRPARRAAALVPVAVAMLFALSFSLSASLLAGLLGRRGEFVTTPKRGATRRADYAARFDAWCLAEIGAGLAQAACALWAAQGGLYLQAGLFGFLALSFAGAGVASLRGVRLAPLVRHADASSAPIVVQDSASP